jgi:autotransporter-associated beta strand protein
MNTKLPSVPRARHLATIAAILLCASSGWAQNLVTNGDFSSGLTNWTTNNFGIGSPTFGTNANGPTDTSGASGNYAFAGGGTFALLQQDLGLTNGQTYRLTFSAGGSAAGQPASVLSLRQEALGNYNSASFDFTPSTASFQTYTVDFTAGTGTIGLWLRNNGANYTAWDSVSVTAITNVQKALDFYATNGFSGIISDLSGPGAVTVTGSGYLTLSGNSTYTGGTVVNLPGGQSVYATTSPGALGATNSGITVTAGVLDLRTTITRGGTGTITLGGQGAALTSGDTNNPGFLINNGSALELVGGLISVPVSGTGGLNVTGGASINSSNSYTGATTISGTTGWFGTDQLFVDNANALGAASGDLTISGGSVNLQSNTITRSGNVTLSGGTIQNGTLSKSGGNFDLQGGTVIANASLAGTAGLTKSGAGGANFAGSNSYTGGTTISDGILYVTVAGTLGNASGVITISNTTSTATLDLRNAQTRTGTITMIGEGARLASGDTNNPGSLINNGNALEFGGGLITVPVSGTGGLNVTGGGSIDSSNSYTGATTISGTTGWYGTDQFFVNNTNALGAASGDLTMSGGTILLQSNTITRSGNVTISGGTLATGTLEKTGGVFALQGGNGSVGVVLAGTAGLTKSGAGTNYLYSSNTYTGATTISGGTLVTDGEGQLTAGTTLAISNGATWQMTGTFSTNGGTRTIGGLTGNGTVQTTTSGFTHNLAVNKASGSDTFGGVMAGSGALVKQGAGTLVLGGINTYTGNTVVSGGSLQLASTGVLRFLIGGNGVNNALSGPGTSVLAGQFVFDLSGAATATNATWTIVANTLTNSYGTNFSVSGFNGVSGGNWTNTTNGVSYVFSQPTGILSVQAAALDNYANWLTNYPSLTGTNALRGADPDGDGFNNGTEFAFDGNPTIGSPAFLTATKVGTNAIFNYVARKNPPGGVSYQVQSTTNLAVGLWASNAVTVSNSANTNGINIPADYERKEFTVPAAGKEFYRVQATLAP